MAWGYYAYIIGADGHIEHRIDVPCGNDEDAERYAERLVNGYSIELWQEKRMVATFGPKTVTTGLTKSNQ